MIVLPEVLKSLDSLAQEPGAHLAVVYGPRQVGKTTALQAWLQSQHSTSPSPLPNPQFPIPGSTSSPPLSSSNLRLFYWQAPLTSTANQLRSLAQAWFRFLQPNARLDPSLSYNSWARFWDEVAAAAQSQRITLVLDDFFQVLATDSSAEVALRNAWDYRLRGKTQALVILAGTPLGPAQWSDLRKPGPLFRRAVLLPADPLPYPALADWLPAVSPAERLAAYALTGGRAGLLVHWHPDRPLAENLAYFLSPLGPLRSLVERELLEQLDSPHNYAALLDAIAQGADSLSAMARAAGIARSNVLKYLSVLQSLGWVSREVPVTVRYPRKSRQGRYAFSDGALQAFFHLRHLLPSPDSPPSLAALEDLVSRHVFPALCRLWLSNPGFSYPSAVSGGENNTGRSFDRTGALWKTARLRSSQEIPVAAVDFRRKHLVVGACLPPGGPSDLSILKTQFLEPLLALARQFIPDESWSIEAFLFARDPLPSLSTLPPWLIFLS